MSIAEERKKLEFWFNDVFKNNGFSELEYNFQKLDETGGYSSDMIFVSVIADKNGIKQVFEIIVKRSKQNDIVLHASDIKLVFTTEINLYTEIVPYYKKFAEARNVPAFDNIPHCFGTISDGNNFLILLENLKPKNFRMNELECLMDLEQAKLVIRAYANWHAINLACRDQEPDKFAFFEELMSPHKAGSICELFVGSMMEEIEAAIELFRKENCWEIMKKLTILKEKYAEMFRDCFYNKDESILVVRHADCWNNNLLFHYVDGQTSPDKAVIIDWQLSFVGSPLADVTQFLFYSCDKDTLLQTDHLLEYYYNSLSEKLEELGSTPDKCFPWRICQKTFEKYVAIAVGGVPLNIRFRHKTNMGEQIELQKESDSSRTFNVFSGKEIRDPKQYFETMKEILEICIERKYI